MRITADQDRCIGSGQCVLALPGVFDQRPEDGIVQVLVDQPSAKDEAEVRRAAAICPSMAIIVREA
jgi:ferredoxin